MIFFPATTSHNDCYKKGPFDLRVGRFSIDLCLCLLLHHYLSSKRLSFSGCRIKGFIKSHKRKEGMLIFLYWCLCHFMMTREVVVAFNRVQCWGQYFFTLDILHLGNIIRKQAVICKEHRGISKFKWNKSAKIPAPIKDIKAHMVCNFLSVKLDLDFALLAIVDRLKHKRVATTNRPWYVD